MGKCNVNILDEIKVLFFEKPPQDYSEIGFEFNYMWITNPFYDEVGISEVNPIEYYGEDNINRFIDKFNGSRRV